MKTFLLLCFLTFSLSAFAHEGHKEKKIYASENIQDKDEKSAQKGKPTSWIEWIGSFHLILLHFPIALINMLAISELLWICYRKPIFEFSSTFLLISSAIAAPAAAILGLIYSYSSSYEGLMETFLLWHMWFGMVTAVLAIALALLKEKISARKLLKEKISARKLYYVCLFVLLLMVNITGFFGGGMTFGPYHMHPPI